MFEALKRSVLFLASLVLAGCAATVTQPTGAGPAALQLSARPTNVALLITSRPDLQASADWHTFRAEWRTAFAAAAAAAGVPATYQESEPADLGPGTVLIRVRVNEYRYLTPGARFGFGVFTGNAFIDADADFVEFPSKRVVGSRKYSTSSTAWQGVFSAMTDKQVRAISDAMLREVAGK